MAYYDLSTSLTPVTAETLRNTQDVPYAARTWGQQNLGYSAAIRFTRLLWVITLCFGAFVVWSAWYLAVKAELGDTNSYLRSRTFIEVMTPWIYGGLGACIFLLRTAHVFIYQRSFDVRRKPEYLNRILLGAASGGAIMLFVNQLTDDQGTVIKLSSAALEFAGRLQHRLPVQHDRTGDGGFAAEGRPRQRAEGHTRRRQAGRPERSGRPHGQGRGRRQGALSLGAGKIDGSAHPTKDERLTFMAALGHASQMSWLQPSWRRLCAAAACGLAVLAGPVAAADAPVPLTEKGKPVDWWFAYKFNVTSFRGCGDGAPKRVCLFGNTINAKVGANFSQQYVFASSGGGDKGKLAMGKGCLGMTTTIRSALRFNSIYNGSPFFLIWNDQFYGDPKIEGFGKGNCNSPLGDSKGMLAWNENGDGLVLQVTTPSWPAAGSAKHPRKAGNTLGCVSTQNNINNAQHFFSLKLDKKGVLAVLAGMKNASVGTDPANGQIARLGGPQEIRDAAEALGQKPVRKAPAKKTPEDLKIIQTQPRPT